MLLLCYFLLLLILMAVTHKQPKNIRTALRLGYNYLFVAVAQALIRTFSPEVISFSEVAKSLGQSLFMSVQYITFNGEINWADQISVSLQAQLWIIAFIASALTVHFVAISFFGRILNQFKLKFKGRFEKEQYLIMGKADDAEQLVSDIQSKVNNPYIIYIPTEQLDNSNSLYRTCRIEKKDLLSHLSKEVIYHIVLLPDTQYGNLDILYQLDDSFNDNSDDCVNDSSDDYSDDCVDDNSDDSVDDNSDGSVDDNSDDCVSKECKIYVTAFLDNDVIRFQDIHIDNIDSFLVSKEYLLIQKYFSERRPIDILKDTHSFNESSEFPYLEKPFDLCIIGFDSMGQEFLLSSFENSAFLTRDGKENFRALVIDEELSVKKEEFFTDAPYFVSSNQIDFLDTKIHTLDYFTAINSRINSLKQIFISTQDAQLNIKTALKLCRYFNRINFYDNRPEIVMIFHDSCSGVERLLAQYPNIKIINADNQIINYKTLVEREFDIGARATHEQYNKNKKAPDWKELGTFKQASNRAAYGDKHNKEKLFKSCKADMDKSLEFLAQYEHSRWNAFSYARGWRKMPVSDLTDKERASYITNHDNEKRHICLVPWDELDALPQESLGLLKSYDLDNVKKALFEVSITDPLP